MNNDIFLSQAEFNRVLTHAAQLGAIIALVKCGKIKPFLSKNESFRLYGRKNVEGWIAEGLITIRKDGNHSASWRVDRVELEVIVISRQILHLI